MSVVDMDKLNSWRLWSDADYLRELANTQEKNVGAPIAEHIAHMRAIANRLDHLEGVARAVAGYEGEPCEPRPNLLWWKQCQAFARGALEKGNDSK